MLRPGTTLRLSDHRTASREPVSTAAVLQPNAQTDHRTVPWHWNPNVRIAIAPDIRCYEAGKEYKHGGISPQECILPVLRVRRS